MTAEGGTCSRSKPGPKIQMSLRRKLDPRVGRGVERLPEPAAVSSSFLLLIGIPVLVLLGLVVSAPLLAGHWQSRRENGALAAFRVQREQLEAKFFDLARGRGVPRGLRWIECDWLETVTFGRSIADGTLTAFAAVVIGFEAIEGEEMEDVEAVGLAREAVAVFHFQRGRWGSGGRALFNMDPQDAIERLAGQYEPVSLD